ncbi:MAG: sigma-54-dependent Fis family transcriptional regulator [Gammaproteobacteria bacterium]|nr:sigma-54-dependent Fis family transcriptional regulator [Gammaproteobacteria bacterium]MCP5199286.1 sigma-54-dependent Fis family transcriptional regulator [Gammaproteobacteria bacterium]
MSAAHILVVDDEPDIRGLLKEILEDEGFDVSTAENAATARESRRQRRPDLVLLDIWMPDTDGITLLKEWAEGSGGLDAPVIMMSGHGTVETAVEATRLGAYDFIEKPLSIAKILVTVQRALENASLISENIGLKRRTQGPLEPIGSSMVMDKLRASARRIAEHKTSVFISGESGTGKEVFARYIHANSGRADGRFVNVNVAGLARENPDAELFGVEEDGRVTFGSLELANGGTLFLKDIADLDQSTQARLLNALENQAFLRVGGRDLIAVDLRVIASTRRDMAELVRNGEFREDLFYHLNVLPLAIPPLRERRDDIDDLVDFFLAQFTEQESLPTRLFPPAVRNRLKDHDWPGNIRELKNFVQRLLILGTQDTVEVSEVNMMLGLRPESSAHPEFPGFDLPLREAREQFEKAYLEHQLKAFNGSVSRVSERVGIERTHLYRKLRSLGIDPKQIKEASKE